MTAPTEQEIRAALERKLTNWPDDNGESELADAIRKYSSPVRYTPLPRDDWHEWGAHALNTELWDDLRPQEAERLGGLVAAAVRRAHERARAVIFDELVTAGLAFAAEYPDAPRGKPEIVPA
jgi:hypothetical protein